MIISFFGHRDFNKDDQYEKVLLKALEDYIENDEAVFYFGGYGAFDDFAYRCCKKYKKLHPNAALVYITPYITLEYQKTHLKEISRNYDNVLYPDIENKPLKFAITYRNKWMVKQSDLVIVHVSRSIGGAYAAYQYALKSGKRVINLINP